MIAISSEVLEQAGMSQTDLDDARADVVRESHALIDRFVDAKALADVYRAYSEVPYDGTDREGKLAHAEDFGNRYLDYRQGTPRTRHPVALPKPIRTAVMRMGEEVGMTGASNAHGKAVHYLLNQGSYMEGIWHRTALTKEHSDMQAATHPDVTPKLVGLGINRALTAEDYLSAVRYANGAATEFDLVNAAIEQQFGAQLEGEDTLHVDPTGRTYESNPGVVRNYRLANGNPAVTLNAPRVEGSRLANTADTHRFAVQVLGKERLLGATVLGTTAQVYEPFQRADMLRTWGLPFGINVEMAGYHDPAWTQPTHIAQELNSLFDQATTLLSAIKSARLNVKD